MILPFVSAAGLVLYLSERDACGDLFAFVNSKRDTSTKSVRQMIISNTENSSTPFKGIKL